MSDPEVYSQAFSNEPAGNVDETPAKVTTEINYSEENIAEVRFPTPTEPVTVRVDGLADSESSQSGVHADEKKVAPEEVDDKKVDAEKVSDKKVRKGAKK